MPRSYAPLLTSIWQDAEFVDLTERAQRMYLLAISQPLVTYCGVVPYTERRWAGFSSQTTPAGVRKAVLELVDGDFVVLDEETEELWIRSFVKHNGVLAQPQLRKAMERSFKDIQSPLIRFRVLDSLPEDYEGPLRQASASLPEGCPQAARRPRVKVKVQVHESLQPQVAIPEPSPADEPDVTPNFKSGLANIQQIKANRKAAVMGASA